MATRDERRAALILLLLALAGAIVRLTDGGEGAPAAVDYRAAQAPRPDRDSVAAKATRQARPLSSSDRIDLDRAGPDDLLRLPRIGPTLARRIVRDREAHGPFGSLEGLRRVSGVGPQVLESVRPYASFSGGNPPNQRLREASQKVSLNTATESDLAHLPGIGTARAKAIVDDRRLNGPYRTLEDLKRVPGIGPATLERIKSRVRLP